MTDQDPSGPAEPGPGGRRTWRRKLLLATLPWLVLALLLEGGFRLVGAGAPVTAPASSSASTERELESPDGLTSIYKESVYVGAKTRVNEKGFRDWLYGEENRENAVRIAGLGDSFTFGDGLEEDETWLRRLESHLGPTTPDGRPVRTLNFGRRGANTADEFRMLEGHVLPFGPDVVILGFTLFNDAETSKRRVTTAKEHRKREERWWWKTARWVHAHSYVVNYVVTLARRGRNLASMRSHIASQYADDAEGFRECRVALADVARVCRERGVPLIVLIFPSHHRDAALNDWTNYEFTAAHDKLRAALASYPEVRVVDMADHLADLNGKVIWIPGNGHPDAVYAERVAEVLEPVVRDVLRLAR